MKSIIKNFIAKRVAGRSDDGIMITLTDPKKVDFQAAMLEDLLMRNGIDPKAITSEQQLKNIINQIKSAEAQDQHRYWIWKDRQYHKDHRSWVVRL